MQPQPTHAANADDDDDFSDVVLVGSTARMWCSGVIIDEHHVLTAAHCLPASAIALGATLQTARVLEVQRQAKHPSLDAALLTVADRLKPVHGRRHAVDTAPPFGAVRMLGFGVTDPIRMAGFGRVHHVDLDVDGWGCDLRRARLLGCLPGKEILLRGGRDSDTCYGDSGGPLFERRPEGWRLLGITSRSTIPRRVVCGEGGIYVRADVLSPWIEEITHQ